MYEPIQIEDIQASPDLIQRFNSKLTELGLLDPDFIVELKTRPGPSKFSRKWSLDSITALRQWFVLNQAPLQTDDLTSEQLEKFFNATVTEMYPGDTYPDTMLVFSVAQRMQRDGFYINRGLGINTVYVEGVDQDGTLNKDRPDEWNDLCIWFTVAQNGCVRFLGKDKCTTEPGRFYTINPLNNKGAARIAFGQYKAWTLGMHKQIQPALVQAAALKVHRDTDRSMTRSQADTIQIVTAAGINQHTTGPRVQAALVGKYSAGCLVKWDYDIHLAWLNQSKQDYRFRNNTLYTFVACIIPGPI